MSTVFSVHLFNELIANALNVIPEVETAVEELEKVRKHHGSITPQSVVEHAKPADNPLHDCFEWNNSKAGKRYRELQAVRLIQAVRVRHQDQQGVEREFRAYSSVRIEPSSTKRSYIPTELAIADEDCRNQLLAECKMQLVAWRKRFSDLSFLADALGEVLPLIDAAIDVIPDGDDS